MLIKWNSPIGYHTLLRTSKNCSASRITITLNFHHCIQDRLFTKSILTLPVPLPPCSSMTGNLPILTCLPLLSHQAYLLIGNGISLRKFGHSVRRSTKISVVHCHLYLSPKEPQVNTHRNSMPITMWTYSSVKDCVSTREVGTYMQQL